MERSPTRRPGTRPNGKAADSVREMADARRAVAPRRRPLIRYLLSMAVVVAVTAAVVGGGGPTEMIGAGAGEWDPSSSPPTGAGAAGTDDGQRRVLLVGDSLMFDARGALEARLGEEAVETRYVGFPGTGLLSGQGWWNPEISAQVEEWAPDVVIIEACCNYAIGEPEYVTAAGETVVADSEQMFEEWADMAAEAVARARAGGAQVYWFTTPCVGGAVGDHHRPRVDRFNGIGDAQAVERLDWRTVLCPDGAFTPVVEVNGQPTAVRAEDGVHLAPAGNELVAEVTWSTIAPAFDASARSGG